MAANIGAYLSDLNPFPTQSKCSKLTAVGLP